MKSEIVAKYQKTFELYVHTDEDTEYWLARELQELLGYKKWENFSKVIEKAITVCENLGQNKEDHFLGVSKTIAPAFPLTKKEYEEA